MSARTLSPVRPRLGQDAIAELHDQTGALRAAAERWRRKGYPVAAAELERVAILLHLLVERLTRAAAAPR